MANFPQYKVSVTLQGKTEEYEIYDVRTPADPGEIVASVQVLYPSWQEILIERVFHQYTESK